MAASIKDDFRNLCDYTQAGSCTHVYKIIAENKEDDWSERMIADVNSNLDNVLWVNKNLILCVTVVTLLANFCKVIRTNLTQILGL